MRQWVLLLVAACLLGLPGRCAAGESVLEHKVSLDIWGDNLEDAAREILRQTGYAINLYKNDFPDEVASEPLHLVCSETRLVTVLECLARRYGCRYRITPARSIEMSKGYGWVPPEATLKFQNLNKLLEPGNDVEGLLALLNEFLRVEPLLDGDFTFRIETQSAAGDAVAYKGVISLPPVLADYFEKILLSFLGANVPPAPRPVLAPVHEKIEWNSLLLRTVDLAENAVDPHALAQAIAAKGDIAVLLRGMPRVQEKTASRANRSIPTIGAASLALATSTGLDRRTFLECGAMVFGARREAEKAASGGSHWEDDADSRMYFWDNLTVAGFDASLSASRLGGGRQLVARLREKAFPAVWNDPVCAMGYSQVSGRLAVVAPDNVVKAVAAELQELESESIR